MKGIFLKFMFSIQKSYMNFLMTYHFQLKERILEKSKNVLHDKNEYVIHIKNLKQALNHGLILKEVHKAISFNQDKWLKQYIEVNTELRQKVKNDFEKDFIKLMNNAVFGKAMENVNMEIYNLSQLKEQETIWCQNQSTIQ